MLRDIGSERPHCRNHTVVRIERIDRTRSEFIAGIEKRDEGVVDHAACVGSSSRAILAIKPVIPQLQ
jgi:hypothetical protein